MDKLSTKLKLVRSQSMGVGMGGGGDKLPLNLRPRPNHSTLNGLEQSRQASIVLLDERRLEMHIQPRLYAGELLDLVATHIQVSFLMEFIAFSNHEERNKTVTIIIVTQDSFDQICTTCCEDRHIASFLLITYLERPWELVITRSQDIALPCYFFSHLHKY